MSHELPFVAENAHSQDELRDLAGRLSHTDLALDLGDGWTVAAFLAHIAFYDFRAAAAVDRWSRERDIDPFPLDAELTNITTRDLFLAIPPASAVQLALQAAEAADAAMAGLSPELAARIENSERSVSLYRSEHRAEHVGQIRHALGM